jgi:hypothetical protein
MVAYVISIVESFEAITANLSQQMNFTNLTSITEDIIFHTEKVNTLISTLIK